MIDLGGVHVRLKPVPLAHTRGDLAGVVEEDGVVLCGDALFSQGAVYVGHASVAGSLTALVEHVVRRMARWHYLPFFHEPWMMPDNVEAVARELESPHHLNDQ